MSTSFGIKISELRREAEISQKEAAEALGISQALLSHYEKGIRECGLEFIRRVADYYDVTADFLLGLSDNRRGLSNLFEKTNLASDEDMKMQTIYRATVRMGEHMNSLGGGNSNISRWFLALSIYRFMVLGAKAEVIPHKWFKLKPEIAALSSSAMLDYFLSNFNEGKQEKKHSYSKDEPQAYKTLISSCEEYLAQNIGCLIENK